MNKNVKPTNLDVEVLSKTSTRVMTTGDLLCYVYRGWIFYTLASIVVLFKIYDASIWSDRASVIFYVSECAAVVLAVLVVILLPIWWNRLVMANPNSDILVASIVPANLTAKRLFTMFSVSESLYYLKYLAAFGCFCQIYNPIVAIVNNDPLISRMTLQVIILLLVSFTSYAKLVHPESFSA